MILHDAVEELKKTAFGMGTEDGTLIYQKRACDICQFCRRECMAAEFGGRVAEITTPEPFSACMKLENLYGAPLKSPKTRAAALGALNAAAGFLMLTRKTGACNSIYYEDCLSELQEFCKGKAVFVIGNDIKGIPQTLTADEAELVLISGEAFFEEELLAEIDEVISAEKEVLLIGQNCHGIGALLHLAVWCPYGK
ncbi:MAG TPA: hypothetical protein O0X42_02065 [Methanocorpusculum sp.]|nr:hypothetical protein [Methanocorpusculum sp.]